MRNVAGVAQYYAVSRSAKYAMGMYILQDQKIAPLLARPLGIQRPQGAASAHIRMFHFTFDQPSVGLR